ncbi:MAG: sulfurtransferase [Mariniphaga sp.]|nr:sulfurtransferase [Mariniphaga sp.]
MLKKIFLISFILISLNTLAQNPLITAKEFAIELKANKNMVVIDVNAADLYGKQHIQGAINLPHKELYKPGTVEGQIKPAEELAVIFGKKGISNTSRIVLYDEGSNRYNSRVWWILKSIGATDVSILHFNMDQFAAARIPLTATASTGKATTFTVTESAYKPYLMGDVQKLTEGTLLLDAREKDEFEGADAAKKSKGHIPGAVWMNFKEVLTATGSYKSKEDIIASVAKFGATPEKQIVVYCNSGIKASVLYIALKEIAGFQHVNNYVGSYSDWVTVPENKLAK